MFGFGNNKFSSGRIVLSSESESFVSADSAEYYDEEDTQVRIGYYETSDASGNGGDDKVPAVVYYYPWEYHNTSDDLPVIVEFGGDGQRLLGSDDYVGKITNGAGTYIDQLSDDLTLNYPAIIVAVCRDSSWEQSGVPALVAQFLDDFMDDHSDRIHYGKIIATGLSNGATEPLYALANNATRFHVQGVIPCNPYNNAAIAGYIDGLHDTHFWGVTNTEDASNTEGVLDNHRDSLEAEMDFNATAKVTIYDGTSIGASGHDGWKPFYAGTEIPTGLLASGYDPNTEANTSGNTIWDWIDEIAGANTPPSMDAPSDILLSATTINEGNTENEVIGELTFVGDGTPVYTLVSGSGDDDNASFNISGANLRATDIFDYEVKSSYTCRIQVDTEYGSPYSESFTISINDVDEGASGWDMIVNITPYAGGQVSSPDGNGLYNNEVLGTDGTPRELIAAGNVVDTSNNTLTGVSIDLTQSFAAVSSSGTKSTDEGDIMTPEYFAQHYESRNGTNGIITVKGLDAGSYTVKCSGGYSNGAVNDSRIIVNSSNGSTWDPNGTDVSGFSTWTGSANGSGELIIEFDNVNDNGRTPVAAFMVTKN